MASPAWSLRSLFRQHLDKIVFTYGLLLLENGLRLVQPLMIGLAINDLLVGSYGGLILLVCQHLGHLVISVSRRVYDTRAFTAIYTDLASRLIVEQRQRQVDAGAVAARSALSRDFVDFFERCVPVLVAGVFALAGGLVMLAFYEWSVVPWCLGLVVPAWFINSLYARRTLRLNQQLHDELERELGVVERAGLEEIRSHYAKVGGWRIRLSDWEALNFGFMEVFILGVLAVTLMKSCLVPGAAPGDIFAVLRYVLMFIMGLDVVPFLVQRLSRLRDIRRRLNPLVSD